MSDLKVGLIGCGFFARNHAHAWQAVDGAELVAVCDRDPDKAETYARDFGVKRIYNDIDDLCENEELDFVDVVTDPANHCTAVEAIATHKVPLICQKPMAPSIQESRSMVETCASAGVPFMVHENFRWQSPMIALKQASEEIGDLFFGRLSFRSAEDVFSVQPYLAQDPRFIIYDLGVHLLDIARFFMGEVVELYCQTCRVHPDIKGEDVATIMLKMSSGATCLVELSYASRLAEELFPQTMCQLEGASGSATLGPHYELTVVKDSQVTKREVGPRVFEWSTSPMIAIQDSMVAIQQHWVDCLRAGQEPATSGRDNLRTLELVFGSYESVGESRPYRVGELLK